MIIIGAMSTDRVIGSGDGMPWERLVVDTGTDAAFSLTVDEARRLLHGP